MRGGAVPEQVADGRVARPGIGRAGQGNEKPGDRCSTARTTAAFCSGISAATAIPRLAHIGDRTGLEMIRTLQDHGVHLGLDVHMEHAVIELLTDDGRVSGALAYDRERGRFKAFAAKAVVLATGGIGRSFRITSNSWEYTGDGHGLAYRAGARPEGHGIRAIPPHRDDLADQRRGHSGHRRRAGRRRRAQEFRRPPLHVRRHSRPVQASDRQRPGRRLALCHRRQGRAQTARGC